MSWQGKAVLVTGGMGFIGSHLVEALVHRGARVRALGRYNSQGSRGWLETSSVVDDVECVLGDIRDGNQVLQVSKGCEVIFHLAALIGIPYSYDAPGSYVETNITGTLNVLQAARRHDVNRVVHTSTSEVYGTAREVPIQESHPLQGQSPYSATKIAADKLAESYFRSFSTPVVTVRPFNTFGPRQSRRAVIPTIISQALKGGRVCLGNLNPTRDLNYVSNTVEGFLAAAESENALGQCINLGSGKEISIGNLARLIGELLGCSLEMVEDTVRLRPDNSEVERLLADNRLAREILFWQPRVSLREGLKKTIAWIKDSNYGERAEVYFV